MLPAREPRRNDGAGRTITKEAWLSVTQWFPVLQQKGLAGKFSDVVTVLILPLIALLLVGNFLGQCLTWQARFPKDIEHAGTDA